MTPIRRLRPVLAALALASCSEPAPAPSAAFPATFRFGAAMAGFQVDMGCPRTGPGECEDTASDWYQWVTDPRMVEAKEKKFFSGDHPRTGPGFYELYADDLARARHELGHTLVRYSIEWSRIFPQPTFNASIDNLDDLARRASPAALDFYHAVFKRMRELGLRPFVTITHYTMPAWLNDGVGCHFDWASCAAKGWVDPRAPGEAAKYAAFIAREFGAEVDDWATENEPLAITLAGYLSPGKDRTNPPGLGIGCPDAECKAPFSSLSAPVQKAALDATIGMIRGHAAMYDAVKKHDTADADGDGQASLVGLVYNLASVTAADEDDPVDAKAVENIQYLYNQLFLDATVLGMLDAKADGKPVLDETLAGRMDWLGLNYYTQLTVDGVEKSLVPGFSPLMTLNPLSPKTKLWGVHPKGLYDVVKWAWQRYQKPVWVTENGGSAVDPNVAEPDQTKFLVEHLTWLQKATAEGVDVRGYAWWSLIDNFEWNHGMSNYAFGLYGVSKDDATKARVKRPVADAYARIARSGAIPADLLQKYPVAP
jgi:beta-glucosidase/6-phospho-beta-glucosidase/beta-galactosidase